MLDFRSDTLTKPTPAMLKAMAAAEVGDDVYGEDPTVNRLEQIAAEMLGFEAAKFMPSGTMTNQVAIMLHLKRGEEVIATEGAHIFEFEPGAIATLSSGTIRLVKAPYGVPDVADIKNAIGRSIHKAPTGLIALENTHNVAGGTVVPLEVQHAVQALAKVEKLATHLDGARLFNASTYLKCSPADVAKGFTTVSICLSKGLGAPVGSILLLPKALKAEAHRYRKMLGGGMRQAGIVAAAGIIALQEGPNNLMRDHQMAKVLADGLLRLRMKVDINSVQTNMVYAEVPDADSFTDKLKASGILINAMSATRVRFVTHHDLPDNAIAKSLEQIEASLN